MKVIARLLLVAFLVAVATGTLVAQEMTKDEWQQQISELTAKRDDLQNKLNALNSDIEALKNQQSEKEAALSDCEDEIAQLTAAYSAMLDKIDARLNELSRLSNQDLWARMAEVDTVQAWVNNARQHPLSTVPRFAMRLDDFQARIDALRKTLESMAASGEGMMVYTVGTWSRDRDCLWNIAKKPKIYDNAFLWPKIWQGNRDQIKNPDLIYPGQKLKIPPKAPLTREEKAAVDRYWMNK